MPGGKNMNKYFISGKLMNKASDHNTKRCEVEKWVFLPHSDFERLKSNPYQEHEAITAAKNLMYEDEKAYHCIMLLDEHGDDGLLIEAEGFDYPRLSMFVPDAALIYERYKTSEAELKLHDMIKETADKIAELAHTDKTDFTSADMIDMDEVESLVKNAIVQQLSQRDDIIMAKNTDIGVDFQPDIHVEAKKLTELKFYCPLKVQREIQPSFDEDEEFFEDTEELSDFEILEYQSEISNAIEAYQYFVEHSHDAIIAPEEYELVQAEIERRKGLGKEYSGSSIFSAKLVCSCCGSSFGSKVWHSTSKYRRVIWQCNHKFKNGEKCKTPHLYEDDIKKRFIEVCNRIASDKEDFLLSCQQIVEMLSDTAALDKKIEAQYIYLNGLTVSMQEFIKENAMKPQDEDFYKKKMAEYNSQKAEAEKVLHDLQDKRTARLSRKELLEGLIRTMSREGIVTDTFDGKLWLLLVEKATLGTDGKLTFTLRNGTEIEA